MHHFAVNRAVNSDRTVSKEESAIRFPIVGWIENRNVINNSSNVHMSMNRTYFSIV